MSEFYDRNGRPIPMQLWIDLYGDEEYRVVAEDRVGRYYVSTVWVGMDSTPPLPGLPPLVYETMVFADADTDHERRLDQRRYATLEEAGIGHLEMVTLIRATVPGLR